MPTIGMMAVAVVGVGYAIAFCVWRHEYRTQLRSIRRTCSERGLGELSLSEIVRASTKGVFVVERTGWLWKADAVIWFHPIDDSRDDSDEVVWKRLQFMSETSPFFVDAIPLHDVDLTLKKLTSWRCLIVDSHYFSPDIDFE